jgi:hypothetical protein
MPLWRKVAIDTMNLNPAFVVVMAREFPGWENVRMHMARFAELVGRSIFNSFIACNGSYNSYNE